MQFPHDPEWPGYGDAFQAFGLTPNALRRLVRQGLIRCRRHRHLFSQFNRKDLEQYILSQREAVLAGKTPPLTEAEWLDYSTLWRVHAVPRGKLDEWLQQKRVAWRWPGETAAGNPLYRVQDVLKCMKPDRQLGGH